jgi:hypothetical protein
MTVPPKSAKKNAVKPKARKAPLGEYARKRDFARTPERRAQRRLLATAACPAPQLRGSVGG